MGRSPRIRQVLPLIFPLVLLSLAVAVTEETTETSSIWLPSEPLKGRIVFEEKNCIKCHSINGAGGEIGPDLARVYFRGQLLGSRCHAVEPHPRHAR